MKNKIKIALFVLLIISILGISFIYKEEDNNPKGKKHNSLAIMIKENENGEYIKSSSKDIPKGNYILNYEKSYCKNNGKIGNYDNVTGKVSFSFIGSDSCFLFFDYNYKNIIRNGYEAILIDNVNDAKTVEQAKNTILQKTKPNFSAVSSTNDGLFAMEDDLGTSFYFRGAVDNNWVVFGKDKNEKDMYWRIIRINGDNSIRMIYTGTTPPTSSTATVMTGESTSIGKSKFSDGKNSSIYVGYQYVDNKQFGYGKCDGSNASCRIDRSTTIYNSSLKQAIDKWYITTTLYTDESTKNIVSDSIFCNDRSVTEGSWTSSGNMSPVYYSPRTRLETNKIPILTCPNIEDMFTINNITLKNNEIGGNGALTYSVSAITADEVAMAGGVMKLNNTSFYLYSGITYWKLSPIAYHTSTSNVFNVESTGKLNANISGQYYGIRPVINLSKDVKLSGNGTWNNVYEVVN